MGHDAHAGRRALIEKVKDCLKQTNAMTVLGGELREKHNLVDEKVTKLAARMDVQKAWLERIERHDELTRQLAHAARKEAEVARADARLLLAGLTFFGRVRFFVFGHLPPLVPSQSEKAFAELKAEWTPPRGTVPVRLSGGGMAPRSLP